MNTLYPTAEAINIVNKAVKMYEELTEKNPEDTSAYIKASDWLDNQWHFEYNNQQRYWAWEMYMKIIGKGGY